MKRLNNKKVKFGLIIISIIIALGLIINYLPYFNRTDKPPQDQYIYAVVVLSAERDNETGNHNWTIKPITHSGPPNLLDIEKLNCYLYDEHGELLVEADPIKGLKGDVTFHDHNNDGYFFANDTFYILGEPYGIAKENYTFTLTFDKSGPGIPFLDEVILK